ncbi:LiaF transmembrane domain-containing protein [Zongyangia hominis]|uniref:LiaF transmembrane domain-containing protein n=1 Tax=Zongyangia hominis TaxID=2763677 RepID=A0A926EF65_9FIRM|nr:hypothetical protein [Zongyangia hominis]MBC8570731.1 hypothetical protein [Zongyangia hominis]
MRRNFGAITVGILLVIFGFGWLGNAFDLWRFSIFDGWWTLLLILPGTAMLFCKGQRHTGALLVVLGGVFLLAELGVIYGRYVWPTLVSCGLIYAGGTIIYHAVARHGQEDYYDGAYQYQGEPYHTAPDAEGAAESGENAGSTGKTPPDYTQYQQAQQAQYQAYRGKHPNAVQDFSKYPSYTAVFSGHDTICLTDDLMGLSGVAIFGGIDTDLSQVGVHKNVEMRLTAIFGGIDLVAPRGVNIVANGVALLGGFENRASLPYNPNWPTVYIHYVTIFGGIDII